jgi:hypothetical protein
MIVRGREGGEVRRGGGEGMKGVKGKVKWIEVRGKGRNRKRGWGEGVIEGEGVSWIEEEVVGGGEEGRGRGVG